MLYVAFKTFNIPVLYSRNISLPLQKTKQQKIYTMSLIIALFKIRSMQTIEVSVVFR